MPILIAVLLRFKPVLTLRYNISLLCQIQRISLNYSPFIERLPGLELTPRTPSHHPRKPHVNDISPILKSFQRKQAYV